jgi:uncharacterized protein
MSKSTERLEIPARGGIAHVVAAGALFNVINTHGEQVVDTWAFNRDDVTEFMSMEATRATILKIRPAVGDTLYSNNRRAMITMVEDTSPGIHDTLLAACDSHRYGLLGCTDYHDNCTDNLARAMVDVDVSVPCTPSPLNLFMNIPWDLNGGLAFEAPTSRPGDYVTFRAEMDVIMAYSACPQDILPVNGLLGKPVEAHVEVLP